MTHPHGYTRDRYVQAVLGLLDHLGLDRAHFLGHSHGGFVAQRLALAHPERVAGVVHYDSAPVTGPEHGEEAMAKVQEFAARNEGNPELPAVLAAFASLGALRLAAGGVERSGHFAHLEEPEAFARAVVDFAAR
ncbi:alpha/beta fold hydrolase [Amycolatopsis saalfeldensis]|uniref:Alpha/beta hydrolase fold n=1 Tax=Amycolatopsis saalfeldensis TaxID=394193 RepID=A0A1H8YKA0_9PSEU|nr:alpha/beta fold hydrolase [Amycolatopsis saalfeldensis]SEP52634.1 alpha/beta hydrolase fold [Amycolatopsis saalfeldensis]